jgi:hypothetical protein
VCKVENWIPEQEKEKLMQLYKLTDSEGYTKNNTHWSVGTTHSLEVKLNPQLCSRDVLHAYTSPLLAALMYPAHIDFKNPLCFTVDGEIAVTDGTKVGCFSLTVTGTFVLPELSLTQRIAFGILCTLELLSGKDKKFTQWAEKWLSNEDRSIVAATFAYAYAADDDAAGAAYAAAYNASPATSAAAYAAYAAHTAAYAAHAAAYAAHAAASSDTAKNKIDFQKLAEKVLEY